MRKHKIVFRVDGSVEIGLGHLARCLALAEIMASDFDIAFATRALDAAARPLLKQFPHEVILLGRTDNFQKELHELKSNLNGDEVIVLDGYHFSRAYERSLKEAGAGVVLIDDIPSRGVSADVVINFCGTIEGSDYDKELYTRVFTGLDYLFLRSPFLRTPPNKTFNNRLLLNMGGTDQHNFTSATLSKVLSTGYSGDISIVVGEQYPHVDMLRSITDRSTQCKLCVGLTAEEMYREMQGCAVAILPPSTVSLEFLSTGGVLFLQQTADNQTLLSRYLRGIKLAEDFDDFPDIAFSDRLPSLFARRMSIIQRTFKMDSLGRVKDIFTNLAAVCRVKLRQAAMIDAKTCFDWANDEDVRKYSYSKQRIEWSQHLSWFEKKIADTQCVYFIGAIDGFDVGQIRFDQLEPGTYQISYSIDKGWRGKGLGSVLLLKAVQTLGKLVSADRIIGFVKKENVASIKAFQRAGFGMSETDKYPDSLLFYLQ